jgi:hypothetical protein
MACINRDENATNNNDKNSKYIFNCIKNDQKNLGKIINFLKR